ncbi:hypothetical protein [Streptomyces europaeiscabiei]|uniref:hypothetical protein n=1 Tax=Streptomyces europaeiscabiei TaxID=146819 RepID=UPI0038F63BFD
MGEPSPTETELASLVLEAYQRAQVIGMYFRGPDDAWSDPPPSGQDSPLSEDCLWALEQIRDALNSVTLGISSAREILARQAPFGDLSPVTDNVLHVAKQILMSHPYELIETEANEIVGKLAGVDAKDSVSTALVDLLKHKEAFLALFMNYLRLLTFSELALTISRFHDDLKMQPRAPLGTGEYGELFQSVTGAAEKLEAALKGVYRALQDDAPALFPAVDLLHEVALQILHGAAPVDAAELTRWHRGLDSESADRRLLATLAARSSALIRDSLWSMVVSQCLKFSHALDTKSEIPIEWVSEGGRAFKNEEIWDKDPIDVGDVEQVPSDEVITVIGRVVIDTYLLNVPRPHEDLTVSELANEHGQTLLVRAPKNIFRQSGISEGAVLLAQGRLEIDEDGTIYLSPENISVNDSSGWKEWAFGVAKSYFSFAVRRMSVEWSWSYTAGAPLRTSNWYEG